MAGKNVIFGSKKPKSDRLLASAAEKDLIEILDYTTREWGISQAEKYAAEIEGCLLAIVRSPERAKPFFVEGIKIFIWRCKCHYIFYL